MIDFFEVVHGRASVRSFLPDLLGAEQIDALLRAAMAAPSAVNMQPWEFVVVEDTRTREALAAALPYAKMAAQAPVVFIVCGVPGRAAGNSAEFAVIDASVACENLLLAATALGLGAVWTALHPDAGRAESARKILGIPRHVVPLACVPVGRPGEPVKPKNKYNASFVHRNRW
jgi:nitroreductase